MHELSIAMSLVEVACEQARMLGAARVTELRVRIGDLSGVASDALQFSFDVAAADTDIAGARLSVEAVPVTIHCRECAADRVIASPQALACPVCGEWSADVIRGREIELVALEIEEASTEPDVATHR